MSVSGRPASGFDSGTNARREGTCALPWLPSAAYSAAGTSEVHSRADLPVSRPPRHPPARAARTGAHGPGGPRMPGNPRPTAIAPTRRPPRAGQPQPADSGVPAAVATGTRAPYGGCQSPSPNSPRPCASMPSRTASTSCAPSGTSSASSVTASRTSPAR